MSNFFRVFFASLLALVVFSILAFFFIASFIGGLARKEKPVVEKKSVLVINLGQLYKEQVQEDPLSLLTSGADKDVPGVYDVIRLLQKAKNDRNIKGILLQTNPSPNGFSASAEIRNALEEFKQSGKFVFAHGDWITQRTYSVANIADRIYLNPKGAFEWFGMSVSYAFLKGTLEKLDIEPQVFYAGKFKSATEPFRADRMSNENRIQTIAWVNDIYNDLLIKTSISRKVDTATLRRLAVEGTILDPEDALANKLVDGLKYDDEVKEEIKKKLEIGKFDRIHFISINEYRASGPFSPAKGDKIALIYAEGNIVDGKGTYNNIGGDRFRELIRKARLDRDIKAIVLRVNSGGGSALASENIWRELSIAKKEKPVVVSFGDVAASGGYYIACGVDSIFAQPNTITGSIGVFGIIPNMQGFFKNKLGITFDGIKTGPYADVASVTRPMTETEKKLIQGEIDKIYVLFKSRVAEGRKMDTSYVDSIAQGRVWTGLIAKEIGLVDRLGGIEDAIGSAARMAKLTEYRVKEYPESMDLVQRLLKGSPNPASLEAQLRKELGDDQYRIYQQMKQVKEMTNSAQAKLPFEIFIN